LLLKLNDIAHIAWKHIRSRISPLRLYNEIF